MDLYTQTSFALSKIMTTHYSSSFSSAALMFPLPVRTHIYAIYGLVRLADEIVDTYAGSDMTDLLDSLESETYAALHRRYSTNPIVHSFQETALTFSITDELIGPFFASMRMDIDKRVYTKAEYESYIYGSAQVVGLMCLRVFCNNDMERYESLRKGATSLGAAFQKINFLRDITEDHKELGRFYFPQTNFEAFDDSKKAEVILDIREDLAAAQPYIRDLPGSARRAVTTSYRYYDALLVKLERTSTETLKQKRVRLSRMHKIFLLSVTAIRGTL